MESCESRSRHLVLTSLEKSPPRRRTERASCRDWTAGVVESSLLYATLIKKFKIFSMRPRIKSLVLICSLRTLDHILRCKRILSCSGGSVGWFREGAWLGAGERLGEGGGLDWRRTSRGRGRTRGRRTTWGGRATPMRRCRVTMNEHASLLEMENRFEFHVLL